MTIRIPVCPECGTMLVGFYAGVNTFYWYCVEHGAPVPKWVEVEASE